MSNINGNNYYKNSGAISIPAIIYMLIFGSLSALLFGFLYGYITKYMPFVYIDFLLTLLFGFLIGFLVLYAAKLGKNRNSMIVIIFALLFGALGEYFNWNFYLHALLKPKEWFLSPNDIHWCIKLLADTGVWSIKGFTPTGTALYTIWAIEGLIIIGTSVYTAFSGSASSVFCESCGCWCHGENKVLFLQPINVSQRELKSQLENNNFSTLLSLKPAHASSTLFTTIEITFCESCRQLFVLNINSVSITRDGNGKEIKNTTSIIKNYIIDSTLYEKVKLLNSIPLTANN